MRKIKFPLFVLISLTIVINACNPEQEKTYITINTRLGKMKFMLYNETPVHKENFITLVEKGFYDSLLFHRLTSQVMIQTGDPESKSAGKDQQTGNSDIGYKLEPEIHEKFFHRKGVLCAAREPDAVNPQKKSSGSQFYIILGKKWTDAELNKVEEISIKKKREIRVQNYIMSDFTLMKIDDSLRRTENFVELEKFYQKLGNRIDDEYKNEKKFSIIKEQREVYKNIGGFPYLDGEYTIFGEIVEGIEVLDKIAEQKCDSNERPLEDIRISISIDNEK